MKANIDNKFSTVQVEYETEKLEAIRFYLRDNQTTVERELAEAIEALFKKKRSRTGSGLYRKKKCSASATCSHGSAER